MKILIVGSGAVAQVFGLHLQKADVEVAFYARPTSAERLREALEQDGLPLYQVSHFRRNNPSAHRLTDYAVITSLAESLAFQPDQIWFTTPSTVYYTEWFREFVEEVPAEYVVCFAPEGKKPDFFPENFDEGRVVFGGITFIAWQGDLESGGGKSEAVHFWLPPMIEIPLLGSETACRAVAELLKKGGVRPSVKKENFREMQAAVTGVMTSFVAGVELSGWSFKMLRRSRWLKHAAHGAQEGVLSQLSGAGVFTRLLLGVIFSTPGFYLATLLLPLLFPFNLEKYMKFHYTKTQEQSRSLLNVFIKDGISRGRSVGHIQTLYKALYD